MFNLSEKTKTKMKKKVFKESRLVSAERTGGIAEPIYDSFFAFW